VTRFRHRRALRGARSVEHPTRLRRIIAAAREEAAVFAHPRLDRYFADFTATGAMAETAAAKPDEARAAEEAARESRLAKAAAAMRRGDFGPVGKLLVAPAKSVMGRAAALAACEAAELAILDEYDAAVEQLHDAWPTERPQVIADARKAHAELAKAVRGAVEAWQTATDLYALVGRTDSALLDRFPEERAQADAEFVKGENWYSSTHRGGAPLRTAPLPGGRPEGPNGKVPRVDMALVLKSLEDAVGAADDAAFPAASWLPPNDPARAAVLDAPGTPPPPEPEPDRCPRVYPMPRSEDSYLDPETGSIEVAR